MLRALIMCGCSTDKRLFSVVSILTLVIAMSISVPIAFGDDDDDVAVIPEKAQLTYPNLSTHLNHLADGYSSGQMSEQEAAGEAPIHSGGSVAVTIHLDGHVSDVVAFLEENGGDPRNVGEDYIEAYVPVWLLGRLSEQPDLTQVWEIIPPEPAFGNVTSQAVTLHQAESWQDAGFRGQGVKVGVIDLGFSSLTSLMGSELPTNVQGRCYTDIGEFSHHLSDCDVVDEISPRTPPECIEAAQRAAPLNAVHGTAVSEAVIDIAPNVSLYVANPVSKGDMQDVVEWMASEGVSIINYSVSYPFDGPGDGTSPFSDSPLNTVNQAVESDILWVTSAGNSADNTWFGEYSDPDGNGAISFGGQNDEVIDLPFVECRRHTVQLRWEDSWDAARTDLDIYLFHKPSSQLTTIFSVSEQSGESGQIPWEAFAFTAVVDSDDYGLVVIHEDGPVPDWIQLLYWGPGSIEPHTLSGSIGNPAESDNLGMLAVGAAPFYDTNTIEPFSSQGPTPDGRFKPDIVGIDCAASVSYEREIRRDDGQECWFPGTSQASPHVAGMAALVRQRFPEFSPEQVADYLKDTAQQRETPDPNNTWGHGLAQLPPPTCGEALTGSGSVEGTWAAGCDSEVAERGHARYYSFMLTEESEVTITLESQDADTYLYLRQGADAESGAALYENDDHEGSTAKSQIQETLAAGTYTIEATTYTAGETGGFTLTVSGLGEGGTGPDLGTDECGETLTGDGSVSGAWAAGCDSEVAERGHARYYSFMLTEESEVTITLESQDADTYLYLRQGADAESGAALYENDDHEGSTAKSQIQETLAAGTYTIEATTYTAGETGGFTLTVSGLGEGGTGPDLGTDECGETLTGDGSVSGAWAAGCDSEVAERGHARYYSFMLTEESEVTITLESQDADTYLYLRQGADAESGAALYENDDHEGSTAKSQIQETLAAGTYTIEATTYTAGETGGFTLTVSGLGEGGTGPDLGTDECGETLTGDGSVSGAWAAGCDSEVAERGHARYYSFMLTEESEVTITLESQDADTYLYLRQGADAESGAALYENDDHEGSTAKSQIQETLAAGTYTIEATTYGAGETGGFTLTVSGLGGSGAPPEPSADPCYRGPLPGDGVYRDRWASGCDSAVSDRGHALYYGFTLEQESEVTITLESQDADTYLYLRQGADAESGAALYENDDHEGSTAKSQIQETLAAGTYTIEATTYGAGETGGFTLTVSGLGGSGAPPEPSADPCYRGPLPGDGVYRDRWASGCDSAVSDRGHALYYGFTLEQESEVTITLESQDADTYLYLRQGADAESGAALYENDDHEGSTAKSQIQETLAAGTYTIEATTYTAGETGGFTLTVSGLGEGGTGPDLGTDECGETLTGDGSVSGAWAAGCDSEVAERGHARYYSFMLTEESEVTITLESQDADTYLYLRQGADAESGAALYENDDHEGSTAKSQIQETLAAGTYTIEATTYTAGETGGFTLTVSGLGGTDGSQTVPAGAVPVATTLAALG